MVDYSVILWGFFIGWITAAFFSLSHTADKGSIRTALKDNKFQRGHPKVMPGLF